MALRPLRPLLLSDAQFTALISGPSQRVGRMPIGQILVVGTGSDAPVLQKRRAGDTVAAFTVLTSPNGCQVSVETADGGVDTRRVTVSVSSELGAPVPSAFVLLAVRSDMNLVSAAVGPTGKLRGVALTGNSALIVLATFPAEVGSVDIVGTAGGTGDVDALVLSPGPGRGEAEGFVF